MFKKEKGFTLIELVTVMAIISALAIIAVGWFAAYTDRAIEARQMHNDRNAEVIEQLDK